MSTENIDIFGKKGAKKSSQKYARDSEDAKRGEASHQTFPLLSRACEGHFCALCGTPGGIAYSAPKGVHFTENASLCRQ